MFITLEGIEGCGKSTLAAGLANYFEKAGQKILLTRQPGGSELGKTLRGILLDKGSVLDARTELFLFLADRAQHVSEVLRPAIKRGEVVICDRYVDSTLVYQGVGRKLDFSGVDLRALNEFAAQGLWPDITFLLDVEVRIGLKRARNRLLQNAGQDGRFEAENDNFHEAVRQGFLAVAKKDSQRMHILDAAQSPEDLLNAALKYLI